VYIRLLKYSHTQAKDYKKYDKILVLNSGSSSLKFMLFDMADERMLAKGLVERIGTDNANLVYQRDGEKKSEQGIAAENHGKALAMACKMLVSPDRGILKSLNEVKAVGHRVVHGAEYCGVRNGLSPGPQCGCV
jgi:acetate kinase